MYQDRLRSMRWHTTSSEFRIIGGPDVTMIDSTLVIVSWTMSEACSGQIEWGTTTAYGNATTEQAISGDYATHQQTISPLTPGTIFHFRTKSTSAGGTTIYSDDQVVTTIGTVEPSGVGVRYGKATWPERTTTSWPALPASYVLVPASVITSSDVATALKTFLNDTTLVPDGVPGTPTVVVFDRTLLGAGTTYNVTHSTLLGISRTLRHDITYWAYNALFRMASPPVSSGSQDDPIIIFRTGGLENIQWLGGEFYGPNYKSHLYATRSVATELNHAMEVRSSYQDLTFADMYIHDMSGDGFQMNALSAVSDAVQGTLFATQGAPADLDIGYCYISGVGRQGVVLDQGTRATIHHCVVEFTALLSVDSEDETSSDNVLVDIVISDCVFRHWEVNFTLTSYWNPAAISINHKSTDLIKLGEMRNITVTRNIFTGGAFGYGNPTAEAYFRTLGWAGTATDGYGEVIRTRLPGQPKTNVVITDNVFDLPADQDRNRATGIDYTKNGNAVVTDACVGLIITGNDFGNRGVYYRTSTGVTVTDVTGIIDS